MAASAVPAVTSASASARCAARVTRNVVSRTSAAASRRESGVAASSASATVSRSSSPVALEKIAAKTRNTTTGSTKLIASAPASPASASAWARQTAHLTTRAPGAAR